MSSKAIYFICVYIVVTLVASWFHLNVKKTKSDWLTYVSYSLIAVLLSPIILKSIGNETILNFVGKDDFEYFQVMAYVTLIGVGGFGLVQKVVSDVFGDPEKERMQNLESSVKKSLEDKIEPSNLKSVDDFLTWLSNKNSVVAQDVPSEFSSALQEAINNTLVVFDVATNSYRLSSLGKVYVSGS
jgi:hypothetical protein